MQTLQLSERKWYAWQMVPGYGWGFNPYFSPIKMHKIKPLKTGDNILQLSFFNAFYAEGVQNFTIDLKIAGKGKYYIAGHIIYHNDDLRRMGVIGEISFEWIEKTARHLINQHPPKNDETIQQYLDRLQSGG